MKSIFHSLLLNSDKKRLASNFLSLSFIQAANYLIPLLILPYILRIIGPEKFGLISYAQNFIVYFTLIINYSFDFTATRDISIHREDKVKLSKIFSSVIYAKLLLSCISTLVFLVILFFSEKFSQNIELYFATYLINIGFVFFPTWFFQGVEKLTNTAILNLLTKVIFAGLVVLLIREEDDYIIYAYSNSLAQVIIGILAFIFVIQVLKIKLSPFSFNTIMAILKEGSSVFLSNIAISLYTTTNLVVLGFYTSEADYGLFSAALKVALVIHSLIIMPLGLTLFPYMGQKMKESTETGKKILLKYIKLVSIATFTLGIFVFIFAKEIIVILFGNTFEPSYQYLQIMALMPFASGINNLVSFQGLLSMKKDKQFLLITIITMIFSLTLNFFLTPIYQCSGTAITLFSTEIFMAILASYILFKQ